LKSFLKKPVLIDCTLRDGGYYNSWNFPIEIINNYLNAINELQIDFAEIGFRFLKKDRFKGVCAFSTDKFILSLNIPKGLKIGVMVNGADLYTDIGWKEAIKKLFPESAKISPVNLVRFACHYDEIPKTLLAATWLKKKGFTVGLNLMQIADRKADEIIRFSKLANETQIDVIYFADSTGSLKPKDTIKIINLIKKNWKGDIGIHSHDNMGLALLNTLSAYKSGINWLDSTITGMGRGPGNTKTEELVIELQKLNLSHANLIPMLSLIKNYFQPLKAQKGWGSNPYYYLSGKYGIHPTYIQVMLSDKRYNEEDMIGVIEYLKKHRGKKFNYNNLDTASKFYCGKPKGNWSPSNIIKNRDILILGSGFGLVKYKILLESFIKKNKPIVLALNVQKDIAPSLIDFNIACHPVRLLADAKQHSQLSQPLIAPVSMLPRSLIKKLGNKKILDFGIKIIKDNFEFYKNYCVIPNSIVLSYALATCASGEVKNILIAGFDGYDDGDIRNDDVEAILFNFYKSGFKKKIISITPSRYKNLISNKLYGL
jgi:4-hydroxy 2-oxovalerate aldolase